MVPINFPQCRYLNAVALSNDIGTRLDEFGSATVTGPDKRLGGAVVETAQVQRVTSNGSRGLILSSVTCSLMESISTDGAAATGVLPECKRRHV